MAIQNFVTMSPLELSTANGNVEIIPGTGRPSHLIDPRKKTKEWILQNTKSIYDDFNRYSPFLYYNNRNEYNAIVDFIQGMQNPWKYQELFDQNKSHNTNLTSVNFDKRVLELLSKYFRLLKGKLGDVDLQFTVKPNNSLARDHEDEYRGLLSGLMQLTKMLQDKGQTALIEDFVQNGIEIPDNNEELEIQMMTSKPEQMALYLKRALSEINQLDKLDQKFTEADYNLVAFGTCAFETSVNQNGVPTRESIDPRNLLVGFSETEDGRDMSEVGKFQMVTINQIREEDKNGDLSIDDLKKIEQFCMGKYGNDYAAQNRNNYTKNDDLYGKYRCLKLTLYFYSYDEEVKVSKLNPKGNRRIQPKPYGYYKDREAEYESKYPDKKIYRTCTQNVYKANWIVGTDFIYNYGLVKNIERPSNDIFSCPLPISIIAPLMKNGRTVSIIKEMITIVEFANKMWKKMEESLAHARPPGFELDIDSFMAAISGLSEEGYTFERALNMAIENNIIIKSYKGMGGSANGQRPFQELQGGLGADFGKYYEGLQFCIQLLQEISGFSNVAASSPAPYTGKKVAELSNMSADYSIKHLFEAKKTIYENVMNTTSRLLIDSITLGDCDVLKKYFGENAYNFIKNNANKYEYCLNIDFGPTDAEWQRIYAAAEIAMKVPLQDGGLAYPDYLRVVNAPSIEEAEQLLRLFYVNNKKKYKLEQQQMIQINGEEQRKSAMAAAQAEQEKLAMQLEHEKMLKAIEVSGTIDTMKAQFLIDAEKMKLEGLIKGDHINVQGEIDTQLTEIQAKYNMDRMKAKIPAGEKKKKK